MTTKAKIAIALGSALAAGVIIGLLVAPDKGSNTRKKMKGKAGKLVDGLSKLFTRSGNGHLAKELQERRVKGVSTAME